MKSIRIAALGLALAGLTAVPAGAAVSIGTQDTFNDGTTNGWSAGAASSFQPSNVPGGGPAGVGDPYLKLVASGINGPGGKLVGIAPDQWLGDYIAAGITAIEMDVINLGATSVNLRLYFSAGAIGSGSSATGITLASGSGWTHVSFSTLADAIAPAPSTSAADLLSNVSELRLFHSATASFPGPNIAAQIGIDNVTAVPEPGTWATLGLGLAVLGAGVSLRRQRTA